MLIKTNVKLIYLNKNVMFKLNNSNKNIKFKNMFNLLGTKKK